MAEEKKNELIFSLYDNMTNELICSGNASIYIIKDGKKIVIANKDSYTPIITFALLVELCFVR